MDLYNDEPITIFSDSFYTGNGSSQSITFGGNSDYTNRLGMD